MIAVWPQVGDIFLKGGDVYLPREGCEHVFTVLGVCVAVVLHSPAHGLSTMCHARLPSAPCGGGLPDPQYVDASIANMLAFLERIQIPPAAVRAQLYGGAALPGPTNRCSSADWVGMENIAMARRVLRQHAIAVIAEDVGGPRSRHLCLYPRTGEVQRTFV